MKSCSVIVGRKITMPHYRCFKYNSLNKPLDGKYLIFSIRKLQLINDRKFYFLPEFGCGHCIVNYVGEQNSGSLPSASGGRRISN